jgi:hypothetical protein
MFISVFRISTTEAVTNNFDVTTSINVRENRGENKNGQSRDNDKIVQHKTQNTTQMNNTDPTIPKTKMDKIYGGLYFI